MYLTKTNHFQEAAAKKASKRGAPRKDDLDRGASATKAEKAKQAKLHLLQQKDMEDCRPKGGNLEADAPFLQWNLGLITLM